MNSDPDEGALGLMALAEAPQSHLLIEDLQLKGILQDVPVSALAYANLVVFSALLFCLFGLGANAAIAYVLTAFVVLVFVALLSKFAARKLLHMWPLATIGILCELALASILAFDYFANEHAQLFPAIAIVASISFISVPLAAHFIKPFLATKIALILLCCFYMLGSSNAVSITVAVAALIIALILMVSMGYWLIRRRREEIRMRLQLMDLNALAETQNQKLDESLKAVKRAKEKSDQDFALRQQLLSYIGHDLRQPINAANYILRELNNRNKNTGLNGLISDAQDCMQSTSNMISDVVQITHYDNPKIDVHLETLLIDPIISQIVRESSASAKLAGSQIRYVSTSIEVVFDPDLLARIVRNLMRNAIKHANAPVILIGVRRTSRHAHLCIVDNGTGIIEGPVKTSGLGLGLQISKQLASICGGQLNVQSELGRGTMCQLKIPRSGIQKAGFEANAPAH